MDSRLDQEEAQTERSNRDTNEYAGDLRWENFEKRLL